LTAFAHGVVLAGLPVLAFLGVDYLLAPPSDAPQVPIVQKGAETAGIGGVANVQTVTSAPVAAPRTAAGAPMGGPPMTATQTLAMAIQSELRRVGCYDAAADGEWNDGTRAAMRTFISAVHVTLPVDRPDYILLTLLQGHSGKACTGAGVTTAATTGKVPVLVAAPRPTARRDAQPTRWTTEVVAVPRPVPAIRSPRQVVDTPDFNSVAGRESPVARADSGATTATQLTTSAIGSVAPRAAVSPDVLAGRMGVGVLPPVADKSAVVPPGHAYLPRRPDIAPYRSTADAAPPSRARSANRPSQGRTTRVRRTFTELERFAP
jgi:hypothetical protein